MSFKLNTEQGQAIIDLSEFENIYVLKGYAGTGKTTVITRWVEHIRTKPKDWPEDEFWRKPSIVLTAPTNKATNVLREKAREIKLPIDVSTIHSLLSLKMKWDKGEQILIKDSRGDDQFGDYDYVVIDESSMLDTTMIKYILNAHESAGNKIIFMGDPCQLPPIGEVLSTSFDKGNGISELVKVMRQDDTSSIQAFALYLRELILSKTRAYPSKIFTFVDEKYIFHRPVVSYEEEILDAFQRDDGRDIRHVAWTNKTVDAWNDKIRNRVYGFDREEWTQGERITTTAPVLDRSDGTIVFSTDTLLTIQRAPELTEMLEVPCWMLWCQNKKIYVPTLESSRAFNKKKEELLEDAKQNKKVWYKFYQFMETFARVKPAYSLTVHRSQGSTFDDVYVSYQNILTNPDRLESLQCLYVAITRPSGRLFLV